jgi:hypothetical protein
MIDFASMTCDPSQKVLYSILLQLGIVLRVVERRATFVRLALLLQAAAGEMVLSVASIAGGD